MFYPCYPLDKHTTSISTTITTIYSTNPTTPPITKFNKTTVWEASTGLLVTKEKISGNMITVQDEFGIKSNLRIV